MGLLQSGDAAGAAKMLEAVTAREPQNGRAWRNLGVARTQLRDFDGAIAALERSLAVEPAIPTPLYLIAKVHAARQDKDRTLEWLGKARATGKLDLSQAEVDPEFAFLRADPRFAAVLPQPADFEHPFVEAVTVLREWDGESAGDQFGWIARNLGDVDGDGVPDVVTSAPTRNVGGENAGRIYVYSTKSGKLLWTADGKPGDQLGTGVEGAGDTNADGVPDVIAGAPNGGKAFVYSGKDGKVLHSFVAESANDQLGRHTCGVGDLDRDGFGDVLVGAPGNNAGGEGAGRAYVYSGKDGKVLLTLTGERAGDAFGSTVAGYSDTSRSFLMVGAPGAGPAHHGRVYVYGGLAASPEFVFEADETGAALGQMFLSVPGDMDGDGVPDLYASDWSNRAKGPSTGRVYVHSGKDGHRFLTLTGEGPGEGFGTSPSPAGDVDGDGYADLIVGAWQYGGAAMSGGRCYLFSGKDGRLVKTFTSRVPGDTLGFDAVGMGDVDGDGTVDFLLTSAWSAIHGNHSGRMFIVSSGVVRKR
jgi:hypothetical protein